MRCLLVMSVILAISGCKKYTDPAPFTDARINNPYCNVPSALNYNWGFPGIPDNSLCIYPSTYFSGTYFYRDSLLDISGAVIGRDSFPITISVVDTGRINIVGFCGSNVLKARVDKYYKLKLDSTFSLGQHLCNTTDTIVGGGLKKGFEDSLTIKFTYTVARDTGISYHTGTAIKQ